jgi:hypothetical protein
MHSCSAGLLNSCHARLWPFSWDAGQHKLTGGTSSVEERTHSSYAVRLFRDLSSDLSNTERLVTAHLLRISAVWCSNIAPET